ncbi:6-bladed beta-propeller protein [Roseivirga ehrenbergii]|nr:6-bladed beta-propeller protein [Roseivirga ehrenbergii]
MHLKPVNLFYLFSLIIISSCTVEKEETTALKVYEVDLDGERTSLFDAVKDVEITVLEESENSMFGYVDQIIPDGDDLIVVTGGHGKAIRFNRDGEYISHLSERGMGPREYPSITGLTIIDDQVLLLDGKRQRITKWTKDWGYDSAMRLGFAAAHFTVQGDGYLFNANYTLVDDTVRANVIATNANFDLEIGLVPFKKPKSLLLGNTVVFSKVGRDIHYRPGFSDTVYSISPEHKASPAYRFEFGKYWHFANELQTDHEFFEFIDNLKGKAEALIYFTSIESDNWIFGKMTMLPTYRTLGVVIDKKSGEAQYLDLQIGEGLQDSILPILVENERVYVAIDADNLRYILSKNPQFEKVIKGSQSIEKALASENPMIMSFNFKH